MYCTLRKCQTFMGFDCGRWGPKMDSCYWLMSWHPDVNSNSPQDLSHVDDKMISIKVSYSWIQTTVDLKASNWKKNHWANSILFWFASKVPMILCNFIICQSEFYAAVLKACFSFHVPCCSHFPILCTYLCLYHTHLIKFIIEKNVQSILQTISSNNPSFE